MPTTAKRFLLLAALGALVGCTNVSDAPAPGSPAAQAATSAESNSGTVQISGLSNFHQTAQVVTVLCSKVKFETDRRAAARAAIDQALEKYGSTMNGGLRLDIQSLTIRMRCHDDGPAGFESYCAADARLALAANGRERNGREVKATATKSATERHKTAILCVNAMPAITSAVDKVLTEALADLQNGLATQTNVPAR
jgi:hypothetical protein